MNGRLIGLLFADMAELADALDLGSSGRPCRFDSCYPHEARWMTGDDETGWLFDQPVFSLRSCVAKIVYSGSPCV